MRILQLSMAHLSGDYQRAYDAVQFHLSDISPGNILPGEISETRPQREHISHFRSGTLDIFRVYRELSPYLQSHPHFRIIIIS